MTKEELIKKYEKELKYSQEKSIYHYSKGNSPDYEKWSQNVILIRLFIKDLKNLNVETVKRSETKRN